MKKKFDLPFIPKSYESEEYLVKLSLEWAKFQESTKQVNEKSKNMNINHIGKFYKMRYK